MQSEINTAEDAIVINGNRITIAPLSPQGLPIEGAKAQVVTLPESFSPTIFKRALIAAQAVFDGHRVLVEDVAAVTGLPLPLLNDLFKTKAFQQACEVRGTPIWGREGLSDRQLMAVHFILDSTIPTLAGRLRAAGVTMKEYNLWRKDPNFRKVLATVGGDVLKDATTDMETTLTGLAVNGDLRAIELAFEITGRHNPKNQQLIDLQILVGKLIEAIKEEVKDPETLRRLSARIALEAATAMPQQTIEGK